MTRTLTLAALVLVALVALVAPSSARAERAYMSRADLQDYAQQQIDWRDVHASQPTTSALGACVKTYRSIGLCTFTSYVDGRRFLVCHGKLRIVQYVDGWLPRVVAYRCHA